MIRSYSTDELIKIMDQAPLPVQQAIESKSTARIISDIGTQRKLHVDVIGKIGELNAQMLLGLIKPPEFLQELTAAGLSDKDARDIMTEINDKIFVPLRNQMRQGMQTAAQPNAAPSSEVPAPKVIQSGSHFQLQNKISTPQRPMPSRSPMPASAPRQSLPQMPFDHMLEDHEEPHIDFKPQSAPAPRPAMPVMPQAARTAPPPPNLPGQMPSAQASSAPAPVAPKVIPPGGRAPGPIPPTVAPTPAAKPPAPAAGLKFSTPPMPSGTKYSADPYREPIDEEGN